MGEHMLKNCLAASAVDRSSQIKLNSRKKRNCPVLAGALAVSCVGSYAQAAHLGDIFVIALENHNFTQPGSYTATQAIDGNTAAPFINSLITPGNANATNVSYATNYTNAGAGEHPSEPNYIWSEAGTNFNVATNTTITSDGDPTSGNKNIFTSTPHLTGLMNSAGVSWKTYQEDYQVSGSGAGVTAAGTLPGGATNPYNGSTQYSYAPKHDPMVFFSDTATQNLAPISQLSTDLTNNTVGRYNWITPDIYNDMHSPLPSGFTYHSVHYTGDQAGVAQGDNFLSIVVPLIEASSAFQNNGAIIIWDDETEGGDSTSFTIPEIVISPLAKGNASTSSVAMNHSSDIKTMEEIFGLGSSYLNNTIPSSETSPGGPGTYNTVSASNDLSSLFQAGTIPTALPEPSSLGLMAITAISALRRSRQK
jgi:phosphatidylinositol-3-phosphatase